MAKEEEKKRNLFILMANGNTRWNILPRPCVPECHIPNAMPFDYSAELIFFHSILPPPCSLFTSSHISLNSAVRPFVPSFIRLFVLLEIAYYLWPSDMRIHHVRSHCDGADEIVIYLFAFDIRKSANIWYCYSFNSCLLLSELEVSIRSNASIAGRRCETGDGNTVCW